MSLCACVYIYIYYICIYIYTHIQVGIIHMHPCINYRHSRWKFKMYLKSSLKVKMPLLLYFGEFILRMW